VVLKINQQYIASAAQDDKYRVEPPFKLQGSYRNMNKMTEKISAVMNESELMQMIEDHYLGEAQLLTKGAEDNLLKLAELRGNMTDEQLARWQQIKTDFARNKSMGGDDKDVGSRVVVQLADLVSGVRDLTNVASSDVIDKLINAVKASTPSVQVVNEPVPGIDKVLTVLANTIEYSVLPLVRSMEKKLDIDLRAHEKMQDISAQLRKLEAEVIGERGKHRPE
jgi:hypothetical protein